MLLIHYLLGEKGEKGIKIDQRRMFNHQFQHIKSNLLSKEQKDLIF